MLSKRENESVTEFTIRRMRAEFLEEARDRLMSIEVDLSATGEAHKIGARSGFAQMRTKAHELLTEMIAKGNS